VPLSPVETAHVPPPVTASGSSRSNVPVPVSVIVVPSTARADAELTMTHWNFASLARTLCCPASSKSNPITSSSTHSFLSLMALPSNLSFQINESNQNRTLGHRSPRG